MTVLITGATGFAGSYLTEFLLSAGKRVFGLVHKESSHQLPPNHDRFIALPGDILSLEDVSGAYQIAQPEVVYHLAGQPSPMLSWRSPDRTFAINTGGTANILRSACQYGKPRVVVVTSAHIYDHTESKAEIVTENTIPAPVDPYGISKWAAGKLAQAYFQSHALPAIEACPFNHIGPRQTRGFVVPDFASQVASIKLGLKMPVIKVGNLSAERDFTDVRDVVRAYHALGEKGKAGEKYLVCSGKAVPIQELLDRLLTIAGIEVSVEIDAERYRPVDVKSVAGSYSKLMAQTGWMPKVSLERSLRDVYEEWLERLSE